MNSRRQLRLAAACCAALSALALTEFPFAYAAFSRIEARNNPPFVFLTRGANQWHASATTGWWTVNNAFDAPYAMTDAPGADDIRGTEYDALNNRMVLFRHGTGEVRFHAMDGSYIGSIDTGFTPGNGVSVDQRDGSLWLSYFGGQVRHYSAAGVLLSQFHAGFTLGGIALDPINESLFLLRADGPGGANGSLDDELWEFTTAGASLGRIWASSEILGNGVGLEYLPQEGKLYVTAQFNAQIPNEPYFSLSIYQDLSRVPEPDAFVCAVTAVVAMATASRLRPALER